jgi:ribosome-interacting GTPase 1
VLRNADAIVYCHAATSDPETTVQLRGEVALAGIELPAILAVTRIDEGGDVDAAAAAFPDLEAVAVSILDDDSLERFREVVWRRLGLVRVYLRHAGEMEDDPIAFPIGATVADVADSIHHDLGATFHGARVWGPSARFGGQRVGRGHLVADLDVVEIVH